jgi:hypothetical protein
MKNNHNNIPAGHSYAILKQVCNLIPPHLVHQLAAAHGVAERSRTFTPWSHVVSLIYAQLAHAIGLNDVCDGLRMNAGIIQTIRGAVPPARNTLSHANRVRDCGMAEALYWRLHDHLMAQTASFGAGPARRSYVRRFRHAIHAVDSTTIPLVINSLDWARHRRRKAAAKCHLRLDLQSFLPRCAVVTTARQTDNREAWTLCRDLKAGEIAIFDRAYIDFAHLFHLHTRGIHWVTRARENLSYRLLRPLTTTTHPRILRDELITLTDWQSRRRHPHPLRRVVARVTLNGQEREMVFLTNHQEWSAWSVAELYRARWDIEVFFKEIKQTLQLSDFLGYSANAVGWQIWIALLVHLLLRYLAHVHGWRHSFTRLFTVVRAGLWRRWHLSALLLSYGTAGPPERLRAAPEQAYLPGWA